MGKSTAGGREELIARIMGFVNAFAEPAELLAESLGELETHLERMPGILDYPPGSNAIGVGVDVGGDVGPGGNGRAAIASLRELRVAAAAQAATCREMDPVKAVHSPSRGGVGYHFSPRCFSTGQNTFLAFWLVFHLTQTHAFD
jgi:hypothetical protein